MGVAAHAYTAYMVRARRTTIIGDHNHISSDIAIAIAVVAREAQRRVELLDPQPRFQLAAVQVRPVQTLNPKP